METNWISVDEWLPEVGETVWITNGKYVALGCFLYNGEGLCWAQAIEDTYIEDGKILVGCEEDDLDVTHWHPVPSMQMFNRREA